MHMNMIYIDGALWAPLLAHAKRRSRPMQSECGPILCACDVHMCGTHLNNSTKRVDSERQRKLKHTLWLLSFLLQIFFPRRFFRVFFVRASKRRIWEEATRDWRDRGHIHYGKYTYMYCIWDDGTRRCTDSRRWIHVRQYMYALSHSSSHLNHICRNICRQIWNTRNWENVNGFIYILHTQIPFRWCCSCVCHLAIRLMAQLFFILIKHNIHSHSPFHPPNLHQANISDIEFTLYVVIIESNPFKSNLLSYVHDAYSI